MIVIFAEQYLEKLYKDGIDDKKHRFQPDIIRRYQKVVNFMKNSSSMIALAQIRSLNLEKLIGDMEGLHSVRVNDQYRIEFKTLDSEEGQEEQIMTICNIINLSNHYK